MLGYLTLLSAFAVILTGIILFLVLKNKDFKSTFNYLVMGTFVAILDFIVEYLGTATNNWTYHESIYFIFELVPIELVFLFFSAGIGLRFIFINLSQLKIPIKSNAIFYILMLATSLLWVRALYQEQAASLFSLAIIIGLWGVSNISNKNKEGALVFAILTVIVDWALETIIVGSGSYGYKNGFSITTPMVYGLLTLGLFAVMEKMHKLDDFLDHTVIKNLLRLFGIYREKYAIKVQKFKNKTKKFIEQKAHKP